MVEVGVNACKVSGEEEIEGFCGSARHGAPLPSAERWLQHQSRVIHFDFTRFDAL